MAFLALKDLLTSSAVVYFVYLLIAFRNRAFGTKKRKDPNFDDLPGLPLLGNLPAMIANDSRPLEWAALRYFESSPGSSITIPWMRLIDISKPEWIEYIQKTNFQNYVKGNIFQEIMGDVFGNGIFVSDGDQWKKTRASTSAIFHVNSFKKIIVPSIYRSHASMMHLLELASDKGTSIDFCDMFFKFTMESFINMSFGMDVDLMPAPHQVEKFNESDYSYLQCSATKFAEAFDFAQSELDFRFSIPFAWKLVEKLNRPLQRRMKTECDVLDRYAYSLIDERIKARYGEKDLGGEEKDFPDQDLLGLFMQARDDRGCRLNRVELKDAILNLIVAGRDTTAQALSWAFFHLVMNPKVVEKVRQEAKEILGTEGVEHVAYENYKKFTWTQAVVFETLRLHPSVPKNVRFALNHDQIPGGPLIEPGDAVRWSDWQMGRDVSIWGPDCGEFRPERWINESGSLQQFGHFKFHAFNGGPRLCLGMNLAIFEAVSTIVEILRRFDLEFSPGWLEEVVKSEHLPGAQASYQTPHYRPSLTFPMKSPMMVQIKSRKDFAKQT